MEKQLNKYIIPSVLAMVGTSCYVLADTFFIAAYEGTNGITALNLVLPIYGLMFGIGSLIGIGSATRYSLVKASNGSDYDDYFFNSIFWTILISLVFVICGIFFSKNILQLLGGDEVIIKVAFNYLRIVFCFAPFFMLNYTFSAFVRNDGACNIAMMATILSGVFNIIFDYIFIFPMDMAMAGAALATGLAPIVSMSICMIHYLSKNNTIRLSIKMPSIKKLIAAGKLGVVAFVGEMSNGITTMVFNFLLLNLGGNLAVAAYGVIANFALVAIALFNGVSQGLQPLASKSYGQSNHDFEKRIYHYSLKIAVAMAIALIVIAYIWTKQLVGIFNSDNSSSLLALATVGIKIYFIGFLFAAINIVKAGFYSATGKAKESAFIALSRGVIAIVVFAFILSSILGINGVWLAFPVAEIFTFVVGLFFKKDYL